MILRILYYYYKTLYLNKYLDTPERLKAYQKKRFNRLVKKTLIHAPFYKEYLNKPFEEWPIINKHIMMAHFDDLNTLGIKKTEALNCALKAEETRDFSALIKGVAVGLSSGTSGTRGLFLARASERDAWAGIILAKVLPDGFKKQERIAFFLRANSPLYTTLNKSKKIQFTFFDLLGNFDAHLEGLNHLQPTILSAPSSVLLALAHQKKRLTINPKKIIAVAEVLEPSDEAFISKAFNQPVSKVYQCTEGLLAVSDKVSHTLVMNDEYLIIEKEWLDEERFIPVITDLLRTTQPIVRYRLDDVLVVSKEPGICTQLSTIQGRLGDVCYGIMGDTLVPIFADILRHTMASSPIYFEDYQICQESLTDFSIQVSPELEDKDVLITHLNTLFKQKGCAIPNWHWQGFEKKPMDIKRRRIQSKFQRTP
ncbi:MAG: F390 synthetase-related protein [Legionellales bacterium]